MLGLFLRAEGQRFPLVTWLWVYDFLATFRGNKRIFKKVETKEIPNCSIFHLLIDCMYIYSSWLPLFLVMSDQNFVLSDQDGVLVGHMSFQEKNIICSPATQKLEKHQRLLSITDLYNSLEQNRVMNFLP